MSKRYLYDNNELATLKAVILLSASSGKRVLFTQNKGFFTKDGF